MSALSKKQAGFSQLNNEDIVSKIRDWCFSQELRTYSDHSVFQTLLRRFLLENGWMTYKEYENSKYSRFLPRKRRKIETRGFIDLVAFGYNKNIAIEYDKTLHLKPESICKLFASNANYLIGIARGKRGKPFLKFENTAQIIRIAKDLGITNKSINLIVIENKISEHIQV